MWEFVQGTGSLVGLATGLFVLWERATRHNPAAFLSVETYVSGGTDLRLTLTNPSDRPIIIETLTGSDNGKFGVAKDDTIEAIGEALVRGKLAFLLKGKEKRTLAVFKPANYNELSSADKINLQIKWRFAHGSRWRFGGSMNVSATKRDVQIMLAETQ